MCPFLRRTNRAHVLWTHRNLLGTFAPLIVKVVSTEGVRRGAMVVESKDSESDGEAGGKGSDMLLQSAVLALCKFMCISTEFCSKHLQVRTVPAVLWSCTPACSHYHMPG